MCLLDRVLSWDGDHLECSAGLSLSTADHPLAQDGRLPATAAIEYAAQAMALHGRLMQEQAAEDAAAADPEGAASAPSQAPRRGFLAGLRSIHLHARWIGVDTPLLTIRVERFAGDEVQVLYDFEVRGSGPIARGRAVVVLDAAARAAPGGQEVKP
jgi:predicted hotdog family 3-hydroxylacyl-ACP dehydratase